MIKSKIINGTVTIMLNDRIAGHKVGVTSSLSITAIPNNISIVYIAKAI